jgi:beta-lactamase regulating signal transducer with metallopeptidase domain
MHTAESLIRAVAGSSGWLTVSGVVVWLCLRSRWRLSPGTRAVACVLVLLQGWIWFAIPVSINLAWLPSWADKTAPRHAAAIESVYSAPPGGPADQGPSSFRSVKGLAHQASLPAAVLWLAGMGVILGRSLRGTIALTRMVGRLPAAPAAWQREVAENCRVLSINRPIELKIGPVAAPLLVQTLGSAWIVFPARLWRSITIDQRATVLRHELAHYRRHDPWRQVAVRLLILPHWFNPVAWWAARQFEAANEDACDEVACGGDPVRELEYSKVLLQLNERLNVRYAQALAASGGSLTDRIRRVLHPEFRKESRMSKFLLLSAVLLLVGLASIQIRAADQPLPEEAPASLVPNGGFEEMQAAGDPQAWFATRLSRTAGHVDLSVSKAGAHAGQRGVAVLIGENHPAERVDYNWTTDAQGWQPGESYELSGWIKVENTAQPAVIMAQFLGEPGTPILGGATTQKSAPIQGSVDWTRVSTRFEVPRGTRVVRVRVGMSSAGNPGGKAWVDDISLVKVEE